MSVAGLGSIQDKIRINIPVLRVLLIVSAVISSEAVRQVARLHACCRQLTSLDQRVNWAARSLAAR